MEQDLFLSLAWFIDPEFWVVSIAQTQAVITCSVICLWRQSAAVDLHKSYQILFP